MEHCSRNSPALVCCPCARPRLSKLCLNHSRNCPSESRREGGGSLKLAQTEPEHDFLSGSQLLNRSSSSGREGISPSCWLVLVCTCLLFSNMARCVHSGFRSCVRLECCMLRWRRRILFRCSAVSVASSSLYFFHRALVVHCSSTRERAVLAGVVPSCPTPHACSEDLRKRKRCR